MMRILSKSLVPLSILYLAAAVGSFAASRFVLPGRPYQNADAACYWTDAMIGYITCGPNAPASEAAAAFLNFWLYFFYAPLFMFSALDGKIAYGLAGLLATAVLYSPFGFLLWRGLIRLRGR